MKALKHQGLSRDDLPYRAPLQPFGSWFALIATAIVTLFKGRARTHQYIQSALTNNMDTGFDTFIPFTKDTFVTSYIGLPTFVLFWGGYKLWFRTKVIPISEIDLVSGKRVIDEEEERYLHMQELKGPRTRWQKIWDAL
jgi:yeast amino acid transporter